MFCQLLSYYDIFIDKKKRRYVRPSWTSFFMRTQQHAWSNQCFIFSLWRRDSFSCFERVLLLLCSFVSFTVFFFYYIHWVLIILLFLILLRTKVSSLIAKFWWSGSGKRMEFTGLIKGGWLRKNWKDDWDLRAIFVLIVLYLLSRLRG